jgi:hypothetical protein
MFRGRRDDPADQTNCRLTQALRQQVLGVEAERCGRSGDGERDQQKGKTRRAFSSAKYGAHVWAAFGKSAPGKGKRRGVQ